MKKMTVKGTYSLDPFTALEVRELAVAIRCGVGLATLNRADFVPFCRSGLTLA